MQMKNDGNGTCYERASYQNVISENENNFVMQVKQGGTASKVTPIKDCIEIASRPQNYQQLKNKGGFAAMNSAAGCNDSTMTSSHGILIVILGLITKIISYFDILL